MFLEGELDLKVINRILEETKRATCHECGSELEYEQGDVFIGQYGCGYITCPVCNEDVFLEDYDTPDLTVDTVQWPQHFALPSDDAADMDDNQIQKWVKDCLAHLDKSEDNGEFACMGSGNTMVIVHKYDDEYQIIVTKSYADTYVSR